MSTRSTTRNSLRVAHTSDWHLGIELGRQSRHVDHERAIDSIVEACRDFAPDAIVHTGDLFDHARPGADDQALAVDALGRLSAIAPTVVVAGNHDNNVMLEKAWQPLAALAGAGRLQFRGYLRRPEDGGVIPIPSVDGSRRVLVCVVPFVTQHSFARFDLPGKTTQVFTEGIKRAHDVFDAWLEANVDPARDKVIWAAHLLVSGAQPAGSERRVDLGDYYATSAAQIPAVSYAAFGHIHRAQPLPGAITGEYAGGMLHFRFDETRSGNPEKSIVLVELPTAGAANVSRAPIDTGRRLAEVTATLDELPALAEELRGALVSVSVPLEGATPNLVRQVHDILPDSIVVEVRPLVEHGAKGGTAKSAGERAEIDEMLAAWLEENPVEGADGERTGELARTLVQAAQRHERLPLVGEDLLDQATRDQLGRELEDLGWVDTAREASEADAITGDEPDGEPEADEIDDDEIDDDEIDEANEAVGA